MRILLVEDNVALQQVIEGVLTDAGHEVKTSAGSDEGISAMLSFSPELVLLDIDISDGNGLQFIDSMQMHDPPLENNIVLLRSWNDQIPKDNSVIKGYIQKPFTAARLLGKVHDVAAEGTEKPKKAAPEETHAEAPKTTLAERGLFLGESYVFFREGQSDIYDIISSFDKESFDVLLVTTGKSKVLREMFGKSIIKTMGLSLKFMGGYFNIYRLGTLINDVSAFIAERKQPVVAFDDINPLIDRNGMNSVLTAIHQMVSEDHGKKVTFLVSVDIRDFTNKDKEILLNRMKRYDPTGE